MECAAIWDNEHDGGAPVDSIEITTSNTASYADYASAKTQLKSLYEKIEDLKIIEDIAAKQEPTERQPSLQAQQIINQLQQEITEMSQHLLQSLKPIEQ